MNGVGRITENKWMRRLRSDLCIVLDLILRSDLRFGPAQNEHLVVRTDGHWPFRASGLLEPLARLAKEGEKICRASGPAVNVEACTNFYLPQFWFVLKKPLKIVSFVLESVSFPFMLMCMYPELTLTFSICVCPQCRPALIDAVVAAQTSAGQAALTEFLDFTDPEEILLPERYLLAMAFTTHPTSELLQFLLVCEFSGFRMLCTLSA